MSDSDWLARRVLVTVGTGGVGKTTVAAAIGLEAARRGKRVLVLTIDPARRLADALGLSDLGNAPTSLPQAALAEVGIVPPGHLDAMMLDTKRTFDELVERYSPDEASLQRILANPLYRNLTDALQGSREYSAMEKLHQLHSTDRYDLIVLDTPPEDHALEFLDAPRRLTGFLESQFLKLLLRPALAMGRTGFRLFRLGSSTVLRTLEKLTGLGFLIAISEFLLAFEAMLEGFSSRARETEALLRDPSCGFLLISGPDPSQLRRAADLSTRLLRERIHLIGLVVNRVRVWPGEGPPPLLDSGQRAALGRWLASELEKRGTQPESSARAEALVETLCRLAARAHRDARVCEELAGALQLTADQVRAIPLFSADVHDLRSLHRMAESLFGAEADA